ncbi:inhibitor of cysteine peptidase [Methanococcus voltae PS]|uniref:Inhibitor of cysteine peptidase n=1 Tax=Methanococcus voltae PS TaxID=523842 RepID=A0ABT2EVB2_METVO|nr:protease inhibitor I42 family protein [Methanococcus voltae]MCS3921892.1 inhibitor of cysteine peptidase [Methanococcus voltae PS]
MYKKLFAVLAVILAILVSGCVTEQPTGEINQSTNPDDTSNSSKYSEVNITQHVETMTFGKTIPTLGKTLINLKENPSTGYGWNYTIEGDKDAIEIIEDKYIAPESDLDGAPGTRSFLIEGKKAGQAKIIFKYERNWENNSEVKEYTCIVNVIKIDRYEISKNPNITRNYNTKVVLLNDEMQVSLPENPSTGYKWVVDNGAPKILELVSSKFINEKNAEDTKDVVVGAGGNRIWTYKCSESVTVRLTYYLVSPANEVTQVEYYDVYIDLKDAEKVAENKSVKVGEELSITHAMPKNYAGYAIEISNKEVLNFETVSNADDELNITWIFNATKSGDSKLIIREYFGEENTDAEKITTYNVKVEDDVVSVISSN